MNFQKTYLIIASVIFILLLIVTIILLFYNKNVIFAPIVGECPDYWIYNKNKNTCKNIFNVGSDTIPNEINFSAPMWQGMNGACKKKKFAEANLLSWNGITDGSLHCDNVDVNLDYINMVAFTPANMNVNDDINNYTKDPLDGNITYKNNTCGCDKYKNKIGVQPININNYIAISQSPDFMNNFCGLFGCQVAYIDSSGICILHAGGDANRFTKFILNDSVNNYNDLYFNNVYTITADISSVDQSYNDTGDLNVSVDFNSDLSYSVIDLSSTEHYFMFTDETDIYNINAIDNNDGVVLNVMCSGLYNNSEFSFSLDTSAANYTSLDISGTYDASYIYYYDDASDNTYGIYDNDNGTNVLSSIQFIKNTEFNNNNDSMVRYGDILYIKDSNSGDYYQFKYNEDTSMNTTSTLDNDSCSFRIMYLYDSSNNNVGDIINYSENFILQIILQGCNSNNNYNREGYFKIKQTTSNPKFYLNEI